MENIYFIPQNKKLIPGTPCADNRNASLSKLVCFVRKKLSIQLKGTAKLNPWNYCWWQRELHCETKRIPTPSNCRFMQIHPDSIPLSGTMRRVLRKRHFL
jgi:hypothetical protein